MKTKGELIIEALKSGKDLSLSEITAHISESIGKAVKLTDISSVLTKLSRPDKSDIGFFIQRRKKPKSPYRYKFVPEVLEMTNDELIGLSHKTGKNRFTLEEAVEKYPEIKKYVKSNMVKTPKDTKTEKPGKVETVQDEAPAGNDQAYSPELNEAIEALRPVLAHGLNVNVNLNIRFLR